MVSVAEEWRSIEGYPDYEVSNRGRVRSLGRIIRDCNGDRERFFKGKVLKQSKQNQGYLQVMLCRDPKIHKRFLVHRLVAQAFVEPIPECLCVNHVDGVKTNNFPENLEWVTQKENIEHSISSGLTKQNGENSVNSKLTERLILEAHANVRNGASIRSEAKRIGISYAPLYMALHGMRWKHLNLQVGTA